MSRLSNRRKGLRYPTVLYRLTNNQSLVQQTHDAVQMTTDYHGSRSGVIIADEHLGGHNSQRGYVAYFLASSARFA